MISHKIIFELFDFLKYFHNFTLFRGYSRNMFEIDIRRMFLEYPGNITSWLLEFSQRSTFVIIKSYTFNTKITFPQRTSKNIFSLKMFPKCSLDVLNIATLRKHIVNIPGILRAGWVRKLSNCHGYFFSLSRFSGLWGKVISNQCVIHLTWFLDLFVQAM